MVAYVPGERLCLLAVWAASGITRKNMRTPSFQIPKEGKLPVTKLDAAVRQLETAITLWFFDGDPVSICTLTFAGYEIINNLNQGFKGPPTMLTGRGVKEEYKKQVVALHRAAPNFFKHAGKDPHETHFFAANAQHLTLLDAVSTYAAWKIQRRPIFETFTMWLWLTEPKFFLKRPEHVGLSGNNADFLISRGKKHFFNDMLPSFTRQIAGVG